MNKNIRWCRSTESLLIIYTPNGNPRLATFVEEELIERIECLDNAHRSTLAEQKEETTGGVLCDRCGGNGAFKHPNTGENIKCGTCGGTGVLLWAKKS